MLDSQWKTMYAEKEFMGKLSKLPFEPLINNNDRRNAVWEVYWLKRGVRGRVLLSAPNLLYPPIKIKTKIENKKIESEPKIKIMMQFGKSIDWREGVRGRVLPSAPNLLYLPIKIKQKLKNKKINPNNFFKIKMHGVLLEEKV